MLQPWGERGAEATTLGGAEATTLGGAEATTLRTGSTATRRRTGSTTTRRRAGSRGYNPENGEYCDPEENGEYYDPEENGEQRLQPWGEQRLQPWGSRGYNPEESVLQPGLEEGALVSNVRGGSQSKTTIQTGAHVGDNVSVQVRHDQNDVAVHGGVGDHLHLG
jgi:hypothetical protein